MCFITNISVLSICFLSNLEGDLEAVQDILYGYLSHQNKQELATKTKLSRSSIYNAVKGNPSLETLLKILKEAS